jgi:hypothetical protein
MTDDPGTVLWKTERTHTTYGYEAVELCINLADELLIIVADEDADRDAASTLTRQDATALRDALTAYLTEETPSA